MPNNRREELLYELETLRRERDVLRREREILTELRDLREIEELDALVTDTPPRDLLADVLKVLRGDRRTAAETAVLLRDLAPGYGPYRSLNGVRLRALLADQGVPVLRPNGTVVVVPATVQQAVDERDRLITETPA